MPYEIQEFLDVPTLKVIYQIPEIEVAQGNHAQRVRNEYYAKGIFPEWRDVGCLNVDKVHSFDEKILTMAVDFVYSGGPEKRKKLRDDLDMG